MNLHDMFWKRPNFIWPRPQPAPATLNDLKQTEANIKQFIIEQIKNMKLSELAAALKVVDGKVDTIGANVAALKAGQTDPELPADAASNLTALTANVDSVVTASNPS